MCPFGSDDFDFLVRRGSLDTQAVRGRKQARSRYGAKKEKS